MVRLYDQNVWGNFARTEKIGNRNQYILGLIKEYKPDFCTFQECNPSTSRSGKDPMQEILSYAYAEASPENAMKNFTPVFYNTERFECIDEKYEPLEGFNDWDSKSITYAVLKEKETGKLVAVFSTHFWWEYNKPEDNLQRLANVDQLKKLCDEVFEKYGCPIIISGDFNNGYQNNPQLAEPYEKMKKLGFVDIRYTAPITTDKHTCRDGEDIKQVEDGIYVGTGEPKHTIDYVFTYKNHLKALKFEVNTSQEALNSSDHSPLITDFEF
jgi:endonuclease/exonuclease/phosphatase family metal-dependent hydrolase